MLYAAYQRERAAIQHPTATRYPSWFTYKAGIRTLNVLTSLQEWLMPPDLQALQLGLHWFDSILVYQLAASGALDAFPPHSGRGKHGVPCLRCEEINLHARKALHLPYLSRLLHGATTLHVLDYHAGQDCFSLTPLGVRFQRGGSMHALAMWHDGWTMKVFYDGLRVGLETGEVPFQAAHNTSFWTYLGAHPGRRRLFDTYLNRLTGRLVGPLADAFEQAMVTAEEGRDMLRRPSLGKYVCDIGGGSDANPLLTTILTRYPGAKGVVYDLPEASHGHDMSLREGGDEEDEGEDDEATDGKTTSKADACRRIKRVAGSFLTEGEMAYKLGSGGGAVGGWGGCDVMVLKNVLHDWGDDESLAILGNVRDAMLVAGGGPSTIKKHRLVVFESMVGAGAVDDLPRTLPEEEGQDDGGGGGKGLVSMLTSFVGLGHGQSTEKQKNPLYDRLTATMDLTMLAMLGTGKERTEGEFRALFAKGGFRLVKIVPTKSPLVLMLLELVV